MDDVVQLRGGLFAAACGLDLVLLDTLAGCYDLAPGVAQGLSVDASGQGLIFHTPYLLAAFTEAGLLAEGVADRRLSLPSPPSRSALLGSGLISATGVARHGAALLEMARSYYRRPLPRLITQVRANELAAVSRKHPPTLAEVLNQARTFDRLLAWTPLQGACVYRSYMLRRWLQAAGVGGVKWVFGVRTWPFYAHCWLQIDDVSLTDHPEALLAFSPIFAV